MCSSFGRYMLRFEGVCLKLVVTAEFVYFGLYVSP